MDICVLAVWDTGVARFGGLWAEHHRKLFGDNVFALFPAGGFGQDIVPDIHTLKGRHTRVILTDIDRAIAVLLQSYDAVLYTKLPDLFAGEVRELRKFDGDIGTIPRYSPVHMTSVDADSGESVINNRAYCLAFRPSNALFKVCPGGADNIDKRVIPNVAYGNMEFIEKGFISPARLKKYDSRPMVETPQVLKDYLGYITTDTIYASATGKI